MKAHKPDYLIIICLAVLVVFGLVTLASASSHLGQTKFGDSLYYLKHQMLYGLGLGFLGFLAAYKINYRRYEKAAIFLLLLSIVTLVLVFTPLGFKAGGAERWVRIGLITFQPAEFLKITFILYLAAWLAGQKDRHKSFYKGFVPLFVILAVIAGLLFKQPATTTVVIIIASAMIIYFISGAKIRYLGAVALMGALAIGSLIYLTPYRLERVMSFLQPEANPLGGGYHINQALIAIGSGGLTGVGFGESTTKIQYLPEPIGDSIFAVMAEEFGFIGSLALITIFAVLVLKIMFLARKTRDRFGKLALIGFGSLISLQVFVNIAAISGLIPLTGVPLPFISYGGTSLAIFITMGGIIVNISKYS